MDQLRFSDLLEKFLDESISVDELDVFLTVVKERKDDVLIQNTILEKLESGAYTGLSEQSRWKELYQQTLVRARERQEAGVNSGEMDVRSREMGVNSGEMDLNSREMDVRSREMNLNSREMDVSNREMDVDAGVKWMNKENGTRQLKWNSLWTRTAVAAFVMILLGVSVYVLMNNADRQVKRNVVGVMDTKKMVGYARHIVLPDNSSVVLNAGSTLEFPAVFGGSREVRLKGEAYFDIRADADRPFIIYTGDVKTTVLGTAFNIKAYPLTSKITVSVSSGKVRVEDGKKVLAVLDKDQQVVYNVVDEVARQETVNAHDITDWTMRDMVFEEVSFESVVQLLSRRYGVVIEFKNPALKNCTIKASFGGTESLQNVLKILSTISNSSYVEENGKYVILGEGCNG